MRATAGRWARLAGPPLLAFVAARAALGLAAALSGHAYFTPASWVRFDSNYYLSIAQYGYNLYHCVSGYQPTDWCGNSGWFPLYPAAVHLLGLTGLSLPRAAVLTSAAWSLAGLIVLWVAFLRDLPAPGRYLALTFAAFLPGQIYLHAVFPLAMASTLTVVFLAAVARERWVAAGVSGALAVMAYPTAVVLAPVTALWLLYTRRGQAGRWRPALLIAAFSACGLAAVALATLEATGRADAFLLVHARYHAGVHLPLTHSVVAISPFLGDDKPALIFAPVAQMAFVAGAIGLIVLMMRKLPRIAPVDSLILAVVLTVWITALMQANVSLFRADAMLLPLAVLLRYLTTTAQVLLTVGAIAVSIPMAMAYFERVLV